MPKLMKIIYLIIITAILSAGFLIFVAPYMEARKNLQSYSTDRNILFLNYYANMRFILVKLGIASDNFIQTMLKEQQKIFYISAQSNEEYENVQPYIDYLYYIMPYEENKTLNIRKAENRERFAKGIAIIKEYSSIDSQTPFIKHKAFEHLARTYNFINRFGLNSFANIETNISLSENAWLGFGKLSKTADLTKEDNVALFTYFYWNLSENAGETLLKIAKTQSVCSHPFLPIYKEIRASFYQNSRSLFALLVRDGVFPKTADIESAIQSKTMNNADELIKKNCETGNDTSEYSPRKQSTVKEGFEIQTFDMVTN